MAEIGLVIGGLGIPESTRWHDGKVWLCNWGARERRRGICRPRHAGRQRQQGRRRARVPKRNGPHRRDRTLIVADSYAQALTAYEVLGDGLLSAGRVWAEVEHA